MEVEFFFNVECQFMFMFMTMVRHSFMTITTTQLDEAMHRITFADMRRECWLGLRYPQPFLFPCG